MNRRQIAGALSAVLLMGGCYLGGTSLPEQTLCARATDTVISMKEPKPSALPVVIGKKVADSAITTDGIHGMSSYFIAKNKKAFQQKLRTAMNARQTNITIVYKGRYDQIYINKNINTVFDPIWNMDKKNTSDDFDYLYGNVDTFKMNIKAYSRSKSVFYITVTYRESAEQTRQVNRAVSQALEELDLEGDSRAVKVKKIHDYISEMVTYEKAVVPTKYTAYDAIVGETRQTVCHGYALLFYKMCTEAGVPCRFVTGTGWTGGNRIPHAWNMVKLKSKWYFVDVTWDDVDLIRTACVYDYFLKGSVRFRRDHVLDNRYQTAAFKKKYKVSEEDYMDEELVLTTPSATVQPTASTAPNSIGPTPGLLGVPVDTATPGATNAPVSTNTNNTVNPVTESNTGNTDVTTPTINPIR